MVSVGGGHYHRGAGVNGSGVACGVTVDGRKRIRVCEGQT